MIFHSYVKLPEGIVVHITIPVLCTQMDFLRAMSVLVRASAMDAATAGSYREMSNSQAQRGGDV